MSAFFRRFARPLAVAGLAAAGVFASVVLAAPAFAQSLPGLNDLLQQSGGGAASGRIVQMIALLTVLSVAPGLLITVTSFTRLVIALSFLRSGLGLQSTPANLVLISLSLFMTFYVMGPTFDRAWQQGIQPLTENQITEQEALTRVAAPFHDFMMSQVRPKDLQTFADLAAANGQAPAASEDKVPLRILIPAFMISELRRGFEIGFLIMLPFLIIDMIVATLVMSMGMMMMPPAVIALPFKILFFILIDGWNLLVGGLVRSFY
ncbi:flagellar type III secretion system pore protein FliP [Ancylobacter polymorphus]|uniref:Flagellar biosynthetic protein FliP n=1 Tax=Ancylobacter polymorphus TaxID=223390 RepID=A0ABU0BFF6_9HYPH|nr:flagellar type III secretion system pore protein FliP [Ancylobacter polymorphus]MDQ0304565.1 flagellar biosynthetic protein FliP [Ancylobacter polymorphus]